MSAFSGAAGDTGSSAIPHFGQEPGWSAGTSGCIGQVYARVLEALTNRVLGRVSTGACFLVDKYFEGALAKRSRQRVP